MVLQIYNYTRAVIKLMYVGLLNSRTFRHGKIVKIA